MQHLIRVVFSSGMGAYKRLAKERGKVVAFLNVIVALHHGYEHTLSETAWTYQEEKIPCPFQLFQIHGLVHVIHPFVYNLGEI
jgi:hypothetical protein